MRPRFGRIFEQRLAPDQPATRRTGEPPLRKTPASAVPAVNALGREGERRAAGERASVDYTRETAFVRVAVSRADVRLLPPWARLMRSRTGALEIGLAPAASWRPAGYLPPDVRAALQRRRAPLALAS